MTRLTILCENTAGPVYGILGEHGLSVLIEHEGGNVLFDTGQGHTILHNLVCMKKDPAQIDRIVLSHGHYDHTGGLKKVLQHCGSVDVFCHLGVFAERFSTIKNGGQITCRSAGMPFTRPELESLGARFVCNTSFAEIAQGMYLTGEIPRRTAFEKDDSRLKIREGKGYEQDRVVDDQSMVIESACGLVVILGCSHSGVINTLNHISERFPGKPVHTLIGGTHMGFLEEDQLDKTIAALTDFPLQKIGTSHCTGQGAAAKLMLAFGDRFFFAQAGSSLEIA